MLEAKPARSFTSVVDFFAGGSSDYPLEIHQKEQLHDNAMSMMHSQNFPVSFRLFLN